MHARGIDLVLPIAEHVALHARGKADVLVAGFVEFQNVRQTADQTGHFTLRGKRVVRVQRTAGRVDRQGQRTRTGRILAGVRRRAVLRIVDAGRRGAADHGGATGVARDRFDEVHFGIKFAGFAQRLHEVTRQTEALQLGLNDAVVLHAVILADNRSSRRVVGKVGRRQGVRGQATATAQQLITALRGRVGRIVRANRQRAGRSRRTVVDAVGDAVLHVVRTAGALVADAAVVGAVVGGGALVVVQRVAEVVEAAEVGVVAVTADVALADGHRGAMLGRIAARGHTGFKTGGNALNLPLGDKVDHAGDRVGAVGRRGAVTQHFDAVDDVVGNGVQVDEVAHAVIGKRVVGGAQAVEQHQRRVGRQAAQRNARSAGRERAVGGERVGQRRAVADAEALDAVLDGDNALLVEVGLRVGRDRQRGLDVLLEHRTRHHDRVIGRRGRLAGGRIIGACNAGNEAQRDRHYGCAGLHRRKLGHQKMPLSSGRVFPDGQWLVLGGMRECDIIFHARPPDECGPGGAKGQGK